jgi:transposase
VLTLPSSVRVFLAIEPVDMRGSFDALAGRARHLGLDPQNGHLYLFFSRRRVLMKALFFDRTGWCILAKRLERGTFQLPTVPEGQTRLEVDAVTLAMILEGIDLARAPRRLRYSSAVRRS